MLDYTGNKMPDTYYPAGHISTGTDIEKKYKIEFIRNPKDWCNFCEEKVEWWDVCETLEYEDAQRTESKSVVFPCDGHAMSAYMRLYLDKSVYDVKMFEEIYYNGELIQERYFEPEGTFRFSIAKILEESLLDAKEAMDKRVEDLEKELELYKGFVEKYNSEKLFNEYRQEAEYAI